MNDLSRLIYHYESDEHRLKRLTGFKQFPDDLFRRFIKDHRGEPAVLILSDGDHIPVILVAGGKRLLVVRRGLAKSEKPMIISTKEIQAISV